MSRFFFGLAAGALLMYSAMHYHVVRGNHGFYLVPKVSGNLSAVYVDTRRFDVSDWREHKPLAVAIQQTDQKQLIDDTSRQRIHQTVRGLVDGLLGDGSTAAPTRAAQGL